jgi:hypothetical protein
VHIGADSVNLGLLTFQLGISYGGPRTLHTICRYVFLVPNSSRFPLTLYELNCNTKNIYASLPHFSEEDGRPHVLKYTTFLSLKLSKTDFAFVKIQKQHSVEPESTERRLALTHRIPKRRFLLCRSHRLIIPLFWTSPERKHNHVAQLFSFVPWNRKYC